MIHMKILVLFISLILAACTNKVRVEPKDYYLPEAIVGKPYRQVIHLYYSVPYLTKVKIWPRNAGFYWQFNRANSLYWDEGVINDPSYWDQGERGLGDAIEIIGVPTDSSKKEIKIGIWASANTMMLHNGVDIYKEYIIKLEPQSTQPAVKD